MMSSTRDSFSIPDESYSPEGSFMNPMIQSHSRRSQWDRLSQARTRLDLCTEFNYLIGSLIPFEAELYFPSTARMTNTAATGMKSNSDYVQDLAQRLKQPQDLTAAGEGSIFTLPVIHAGKVEAVCCLKRKSAVMVQPSPPQIFELISICDVAAKAIAAINQSHRETKPDSSHEEKATGTASQRALTSVFSKVMGSVAHDLRTPITVIRGFIKMILDGRTGDVAEAQRKCLDVAFESVNRLVDFSATVGSTAAFLEQFQVENFEIREIWNTVSQAIRPQLDERAIAVSEFIEPGMAIAGDRGLLFEVFEKSILAMTSSVRPAARLRIEISRRASGDVSFQISLPEEQECANPLTVVTQLQSIVLLHGGRVSFAVKPESGAALNLIFPGYSA